MPTSVRIGHRTYEIVAWSEKAADASGCRGDCREEPPIIRISTGLKRFDRAEVMLHEIFHACWKRLAPDGVSEEDAVTVLAEGLSQVWRDNPKIVEWVSYCFKEQP